MKCRKKSSKNEVSKFRKYGSFPKSTVILEKFQNFHFKVKAKQLNNRHKTCEKEEKEGNESVQGHVTKDLKLRQRGEREVKWEGGRGMP